MICPGLESDIPWCHMKMGDISPGILVHHKVVLARSRKSPIKMGITRNGYTLILKF